MVGNKYWLLRNHNGSYKKYTVEEWAKKILEWLEFMETQVWNKKEAIKSGEFAGTLIDIPTKTPLSIESLCNFAGIHTDTFRNYKSGKEEYKDYFEVTTYAAQIIEQNQFEGATVGAYNASIVAHKLGLASVIKVDHTTQGESIKSKVDLSKLSDQTLRELADAATD